VAYLEEGLEGHGLGMARKREDLKRNLVVPVLKVEAAGTGQERSRDQLLVKVQSFAAGAPRVLELDPRAKKDAAVAAVAVGAQNWAEGPMQKDHSQEVEEVGEQGSQDLRWDKGRSSLREQWQMNPHHQKTHCSFLFLLLAEDKYCFATASYSNQACCVRDAVIAAALRSEG